MIEENVKSVLSELHLLSGGNAALVAATKTRTAEEIQRAIDAGITMIGENRVQEFCEKYDQIKGAERHFIGHLQTNKVKYLIGKTDLSHSGDRDALLEEIATRSEQKQLRSDILLQVNIGNEESKGGYPLQEAAKAYLAWRDRAGIRICGFMAMLPLAGTDEEKETLVIKMRDLYEKIKREDGNIRYLSMGMSGDWRLCVKGGANMVRLGTAIFGERPSFRAK